MPHDKLLAELLRKYPESVFKYHEHDSLLEKEDDLTEIEKECVWKRYEQEAAAQEKILALKNQMGMAHDTPPFMDSDPELNESDPFWDGVNGTGEVDSKSETLLTSELLQMQLVNLIENGQRTALSSIPPQKLVLTQKQFATNLIAPRPINPMVNSISIHYAFS